MFLEIHELGNVIYGYQVNQITENNNTLVLEAIATATEEVRSYLTGNNKKEWLDGRIQYDVDAILSAEGNARNPLILAHVKTITKWYIVELCNADVIYEHAKSRYDRSLEWLKKLANGEVTLSTLPTKEENTDNNTTTTQEDEGTEPFTYGSRKKFNHE